MEWSTIFVSFFKLEISQFKVSVHDVTIRAYIKIGSINKKSSQIPNMIKNAKNTYQKSK